MSDVQNFVNNNPEYIRQQLEQATKKEVTVKEAEMRNLPTTSTEKDTFISPEFEYKGRKARRINITTEKIILSPNTQWSSTIDVNETGELVAYTVDVNDPLMIVECFVYDEDGSPEPINDRSMHQLAELGRGMTVYEAYETRPDGTSVDRHGTRHPYRPFLSRFKSSGTHGTDNDKHIVQEYAPDIREIYSRIYFTVKNPTTNTRLIHYLTISRIRFIDVYQKKFIDKRIEEQINTTARTVRGSIRPKLEI